MTPISNPARAGGRPVFLRPAVFCAGCMVLAAVLFTGCHKAGDTTSTAPPPVPAAAPVAAAPDTNQESQAAPPAPATVENSGHIPQSGPVVASPEAPSMAKPGGQPDLQALDTALMSWVFANRRRPNSFADFAATAGVAIPRPPPGKKYVISKSMHVLLVDQ